MRALRSDSAPPAGRAPKRRRLVAVACQGIYYGVVNIETHLGIDPSLCGTPVRVEADFAEVRLETTPVMAADDRGLVHGGFVFGLADYAAMLAVNDPNVVLGAAEVKFLAPTRVGQVLVAEALLAGEKGKKREVDVTVKHGDDAVFSGRFVCFVLPRHVLSAE